MHSTINYAHSVPPSEIVYYIISIGAAPLRGAAIITL